jgi:hypothetical protein
LLAGALAATTILAAPASAAPFASGANSGDLSSTVFDASRYDPAAESAGWGCRWNCGWGRGWGRHRGWRRDRVDAGDVLIGAAIIGGIVAIANANNRREREREVVVVDRDPRYRDRDWDRDSDTRYRDDRRAAPRGTGASGLDNAVNMCLDRIERDVRVDTVDNVERTASGWEVSGSLFNGSGFQCRIGNNGQIDAVSYDGSFGAGDLRGAGQARGDAPPAAGQWSEQTYAEARARVGGSVRPDLALNEASAQGTQLVTPPVRSAAAAPAAPAYPGGPIPGEEIPETLEEATGG